MDRWVLPSCQSYPGVEVALTVRAWLSNIPAISSSIDGFKPMQGSRMNENSALKRDRKKFFGSGFDVATQIRRCIGITDDSSTSACVAVNQMAPTNPKSSIGAFRRLTFSMSHISIGHDGTSRREENPLQFIPCVA